MSTTFPVEQAPPTSFKLQHSSPLDSLVRRTSKRARAAVQSTASQQYPAHLIDDYAVTSASQDEDEEDPYGGYATAEPPLTPSRHPFHHQQPTPTSPLLHGHFARNSTATASVNGSYIDTRVSVDSRNVYQDLEYRYHDDESIYSQNDPPSPAIRDSWRSGVSSSTVRPYDPGVSVPSKLSNINSSTQPAAVPPEPVESSPWASSVPTVVVSSPDVADSGHRPGRAPVVRPITSNFSRPVRPSPLSPPAGAPQQVTAPPPLPPNSEEQKRRVLERNINRAVSHPSPQQSQQQMNYSQQSTSPTPNPYLTTTGIHKQPQVASSISPENLLPNPYADIPPVPPLQVNKLNKPNSTNQHLDLSFRNQGPRHQTPSPQPSDQRSDQRSLQPSPTPQAKGNQNSASHLSPVPLPRRPPSRSDSPASLYSAYSYYNYESAVPSPVSSDFSGPPSRASPAPQPPLSQPQTSRHLEPNPSQNNQRSKSPSNMRTGSPVVTEPRSPQDFLQLGIQNHEANRLREAAMYFEKSAKENGGCGVGMLMWGLTLRHGWGCEKNEKVGFKWLRKAAEHAVVDLESARGGKSVDTAPVQVGYLRCYRAHWIADGWDGRMSLCWLSMRLDNAFSMDGVSLRIKRWLW